MVPDLFGQSVASCQGECWLTRSAPGCAREHSSFLAAGLRGAMAEALQAVSGALLRSQHQQLMQYCRWNQVKIAMPMPVILLSPKCRCMKIGCSFWGIFSSSKHAYVMGDSWRLKSSEAGVIVLCCRFARQSLGRVGRCHFCSNIIS